MFRKTTHADTGDDKPPSSPTIAAEDEPPGAFSACAVFPARTPHSTPLTSRAAEASADAAGELRWHDWRWQMRCRLRNTTQLRRWFPQLAQADEIAQAAAKFPLAVTPYYAALIEKLDPTDPIYAMSVPQLQELDDPAFLVDDPLAEDHDMPVPGLVHRYPDRALLVATSTCAMYCRHCTRKRVAGRRESSISAARLRQVVAYLKDHPEIKDVIISGGDPFTMATPVLERVIAAVRAVPSVDVIRIGTRTPVTLPMRIDEELVNMLRRYQPVWVNTHFNHPRELTAPAAQACARLVDAGIPLGNQSVLLRGVNDDPQVMLNLCRGLVKLRVRPYYLFQCDLVRGVEHFRTPLSRGVEIMEFLRGRLSGLAIPTFVVDAPGGGGKIPVLPQYLVSMSPTHSVLRNFEGMLISYPEPLDAAACRARAAVPDGPAATVYDLIDGRAAAIHPARSDRDQRRRKRHADSHGTLAHDSHSPDLHHHPAL